MSQLFSIRRSLVLRSVVIASIAAAALLGIYFNPHVLAIDGTADKPHPARPHFSRRAKMDDIEEFPMIDGRRTEVPDAGGIDTSFLPNVTEGNAQVNSLAWQPDGKALVGGFFTSVNGSPRSCLERYNADGTRDTTFNPGGSGANNIVYAILVLPDNKIMIAGGFTLYNGATARSIARLNPDGTLDPTFSTLGTAFNGPLHDIVIQPDGKILATGNFTNYNGTARNYAARLNTDLTLDTGFNPNPNAFTEELVLQNDGKIVITGDFTMVSATARGGVARLNSDGTLDTGFNVGTGAISLGGPGGVYAADIQPDGKILVGGVFDTFNGQNRPNVARLNTNGSVDTSFFSSATSGADAEFFAIQPDGKILVAGGFDIADPSLGSVLLRLNTNGTVDGTFTATISDDLGYVVALRTDGTILLGGLFSNLYNNACIVALDQGGIPETFITSITVEAQIYTVVRQNDGRFMIGGRFRKVNGISRRGIARINADGSLDTTFDPGNGVEGPQTPFVYCIAIQGDGKLLVGGFFYGFNGTSTTHIVRLNSGGSVDNTFSFNDATQLVRDIEVRPNNKIAVAGFFVNALEGVNSGITKLNSDGSYDQTAVGSGANNVVTRIIRDPLNPNAKALIVGSFTIYDGVGRNRVAMINDDGSLDTSFNPGTGANSTPFAAVRDINSAPNFPWIIGGAFTSYNGAANTSRMVRVLPTGAVDTSFATAGTSFNASVFSLAFQVENGKLLVGNRRPRLVARGEEMGNGRYGNGQRACEEDRSEHTV